MRTELIARLEAATKPDPHLDAEIEALVRGGTPAYRCGDGTRRSYGPSVVFNRDDGTNILPSDWHSAPSFTGSLDVMLTMVPPAMWWTISAGKITQDEPLFGAAIYRPEYSPGMVPIAVGEHPTSAAIALCIAALRAREASLASDDRPAS